MSRMLDDLAEFSGLDARPFTLDLAPREVPHLLNEVVDELVPLASDRGINLHLEAPPAAGHVVCDPDRVLQVFSNVVGNAVKFSQRGGTIALGSTAKDGEVLFTVRDDGPGMAPADLDHIFDKYWQAEEGSRGGRGPRALHRQAADRGAGRRDLVRERAREGHARFLHAPPPGHPLIAPPRGSGVSRDQDRLQTWPAV